MRGQSDEKGVTEIVGEREDKQTHVRIKGLIKE